jgi:CheY-like chemotaxis protein
MEAELEAANRRKDEFLAMLGHELRNPLAAITTALQVARKKAPDAGGDDGWPAEIIERQTEVLRRLVDDLLDVSRITRGKITLNPMPVEIGEHLETAVRSLEQAHDGNVWVTVSTPPEPVFVSADPARLQQVFNNLLTNAVKYSPEGGEIRFSAEIDGGAVMIRCRDQGMGMAPEKIPEIFEPFTQLDTPLHRENAGLGIGLALVKRLVEMHGGSVSAVSEGEGNGTEFRVTLPVIESPAEETPAPAAASVSRRSDIIPRRILLAEDNIDLARSLKTVLEETGHTVELVHDGPAAVSAARNNPPDAAVIDIGLPGLDGYKVAGTIREEADGAAPLLIGTSGYARDPARSSGPFDHYLVKPINIDALLGHIDALRGSAETETAPGPAPADGPLRVLLIEDHPALGTLMLMELRNHGYEAKLAKSGEKGIETAAEFLPHIVLCDLRLPGMNGPEVAGKLREMAATRPAFLVALTADRVEDQMDRLTAAGFDHAVTKPLEAQTLDRLVAEHRTAAGT